MSRWIDCLFHPRRSCRQIRELTEAVEMQTRVAEEVKCSAEAMREENARLVRENAELRHQLDALRREYASLKGSSISKEELEHRFEEINSELEKFVHIRQRYEEKIRTLQQKLSMRECTLSEQSVRPKVIQPELPFDDIEADTQEKAPQKPSDPEDSEWLTII